VCVENQEVEGVLVSMEYQEAPVQGREALLVCIKLLFPSCPAVVLHYYGVTIRKRDGS
jgi:hypothetical protein